MFRRCYQGLGCHHGFVYPKGFQVTYWIVSGSIWTGSESPWIGTDCSTAGTPYDQLPATKNVVLHRTGGTGMSGRSVSIICDGLFSVGVCYLRALSPVAVPLFVAT